MRWCAVLMLVACGHARPWRPAARSEDVRVVDARTFVRFAPDGGAVIVTTVELGDQAGVGVGSVALRPTRVDSIAGSLAQSPHLRFAGARAWYALAVRLVQTQPRHAYDAALKGIDELSVYYLDGHIRDDSISDLHRAASLLERTDPAEADAAQLVMATLRSRLRIYTYTWRRDIL